MSARARAAMSKTKTRNKASGCGCRYGYSTVNDCTRARWAKQRQRTSGNLRPGLLFPAIPLPRAPCSHAPPCPSTTVQCSTGPSPLPHLPLSSRRRDRVPRHWCLLNIADPCWSLLRIPRRRDNPNQRHPSEPKDPTSRRERYLCIWTWPDQQRCWRESSGRGRDVLRPPGVVH